jgi:pterin-4a-carbinolamine dehydratase
MTQPNYTDITKAEALNLIAERVKRIKHFPLWLRNDKDIALLTVTRSSKYLQ